MKKLALILALASGSTLVIATVAAQSGKTAAASSAAAADATTKAVADAATAFLDSLSAEQRQKVLFAFTPQEKASAAKFARSGPPGGPGGKRPDGAPPGDHPPMAGGPSGPNRGGPEKGGLGGPGMGPMGGFVGEKYGEAVWSNYPVSDVPRPGLQLGGLTAEQRAAAMHLLQTLLSPQGYQKILDIMGSDQALSEQGQPFASGRGRGCRYVSPANRPPALPYPAVTRTRVRRLACPHRCCGGAARACRQYERPGETVARRRRPS